MGQLGDILLGTVELGDNSGTTGGQLRDTGDNLGTIGDSLETIGGQLGNS